MVNAGLLSHCRLQQQGKPVMMWAAHGLTQEALMMTRGTRTPRALLFTAAIFSLRITLTQKNPCSVMDPFPQYRDNSYIRLTRIIEEPSGLASIRRGEMHKFKSLDSPIQIMIPTQKGTTVLPYTALLTALCPLTALLLRHFYCKCNRILVNGTWGYPQL